MSHTVEVTEAVPTEDSARIEAAAELFRALGAPVRVALLLRLTEGERCVHELVEALAVPQPLVSQHLRVLRAADLVVGHRRGREVVYALRDEHVAHIVRDAVQHAGHPLVDPVPVSA